jgi:hypothetical protein
MAKRESSEASRGGARIEVVGEPGRSACPDCGDWSRRTFLKAVGGAVAASVVPIGGSPLLSAAAAPKAGSAESHVKLLYESLKPEQRKIMCFPFDHELRRKIANNWDIVDPAAGAIGKLYGPDQKEILRSIFRGVTSEEGYEKFQKQMQDDAGGFDEYTCAIFGEPGTGKFEWVMTGRHLTIRADGDSVSNTAFGGPIFYGHAVEAEEKPDHPGNVWWHQARMANAVFQSLDGKQKEKALLDESTADNDTTVLLRGKGPEIPGLAVSGLSRDQKENLRKTLGSMLSMYRSSDVEEALACLEAEGGMDELRMSFYKEGDLGADGIWDRWRVEGPRFVWYFRGSPHVHAWVHVARSAATKARV